MLIIWKMPLYKSTQLKSKKYITIESTPDWPKVLFFTIHMLHLTPSSQCPDFVIGPFTLVTVWCISRSYPSPVPEQKGESDENRAVVVMEIRRKRR